MRLVSLLGILTICSFAAAGQQLGSSTFIIGAGGAFPAEGSNFRSATFHNGLALTGEYELGLHKFLAANIGVEHLPLKQDLGGRFNTVTRGRVTFMPFGLRLILPAGRTEFFVGTGGAYIWSSDSDLVDFGAKRLLWHANGGFRVAIDSARRFRAGTTVRHSRDLGRPTQQWTSVAGEISFRFGR